MKSAELEIDVESIYSNARTVSGLIGVRVPTSDANIYGNVINEPESVEV